MLSLSSLFYLEGVHVSVHAYSLNEQSTYVIMLKTQGGVWVWLYFQQEGHLHDFNELWLQGLTCVCVYVCVTGSEGKGKAAWRVGILSSFLNEYNIVFLPTLLRMTIQRDNLLLWKNPEGKVCFYHNKCNKRKEERSWEKREGGEVRGNKLNVKLSLLTWR